MSPSSSTQPSPIPSSLVEYRTEGAVAIVRMNRPDALNAFNTGLRADLLAALEHAERDPAVRAVVLGSTGRAFSAGADLKEPKPPESNVVKVLLEGYRPLLERITRSPLPIIGAAPGVAAGVGAALLMACDLVVMAREARIYMAFSHIGLVPDGGATWLLQRHLGHQRAFQLVVEGGSLSAEECLALGIANKVVTQDELESVTTQWAAVLAERPALATAQAKKLLRMAATASFGDMIEQEAEAQRLCIDSDESRAAVAVFVAGNSR